jgi:hypothetical protein
MTPMLRLAVLAVGLVTATVLAACIGDDHAIATDITPVDTEMLREFSGCPTVADFEQTQFGARWSSMASSGGLCQGCHIPSTPGMNTFGAIDADPGQALDQVTSTLAQLQVFFTVQDDEIVINRDHFDATSAGVDPHGEHAPYELDDNGAWSALLQVYAESRQRLADDACDEPRF